MSWPEFWMKYDGWTIRRQYDLDHTRIISSYIASYAFGQKKAVKPTQIMQLPEIDNTPAKAKRKLQDMDDFIRRMSRQAGLPEGQLIQLQKAQEN